MAQVNTVRGPMPVEELGRTYMHEHFVFGYPGHEADATMWHRDDAAYLARGGQVVTEAGRAGVRTFVDATPNECGRDPELLARIATAHDVNIICSTGYYYEGEGSPVYFKFRSIFADVVSEICDLLVRELTEGIRDTGIKAGVIKLGTSEGVITDFEQTMIKAAARAQQATGAPIITHTQAGTMGPQQARALVDAGADPDRVIVGHMCGNVKDLQYQLDTLATGVHVAYDRIGLNRMFNDITDDDRIDTIVRLWDLGYGNRLHLSHDTVNVWLGRDASGFNALDGAKHWHIGRIGDYMLPGLLERGLTEDDIDQMLTRNVASVWGGE